MSAPDPSAPTATAEAPPAWTWSEEDVNAALQSAFWFDSNISEELIGPYRGMHVAIFGERIVDADSDFKALGRRYLFSAVNSAEFCLPSRRSGRVVLPSANAD